MAKTKTMTEKRNGQSTTARTRINN